MPELVKKDGEIQFAENVVKYNTRAGFGCVNCKACIKCKAIHYDSICLCAGNFKCLNCDYQNGIPFREVEFPKEAQICSDGLNSNGLNSDGLVAAADYVINKNQHLYNRLANWDCVHTNKESDNMAFKIKQESFKWDYRFLRLAREVASWSRDPSTKVGAIIVKNKKVVSLGFNGFAKGIKDDDRYGDRETKLKLIIHGEENAVLFADRDELKGATLYTYPFMSCSRCAAKMIQVGIKRVVSIESDIERWQEDFKLSKEQFKDAGVQLDLFEDEDEVFQSHYCLDCGGCGEDGCCSPDTCNEVRYCDWYKESYQDLLEKNEKLEEENKKLTRSKPFSVIHLNCGKTNIVNPDMGNQIDTKNGGSPY